MYEYHTTAFSYLFIQMQEIFLISVPLHIRRMQNLMRLVAAGFLKKRTHRAPSQPDSHGSYEASMPRPPDTEPLRAAHGDPEVTHIAGLIRLTAAIDAAAGAAHHFNEVIILFTGLYSIQQLCSIGKAGCNGDVNLHTADIIGSFLNILRAANLRIINIGEFSPVTTS